MPEQIVAFCYFAQQNDNVAPEKKFLLIKNSETAYRHKIIKNYELSFPASEAVLPRGGTFVPKEPHSRYKTNME